MDGEGRKEGKEAIWRGKEEEEEEEEEAFGARPLPLPPPPPLLPLFPGRRLLEAGRSV